MSIENAFEDYSLLKHYMVKNDLPMVKKCLKAVLFGVTSNDGASKLRLTLDEAAKRLWPDSASAELFRACFLNYDAAERHRFIHLTVQILQEISSPGKTDFSHVEVLKRVRSRICTSDS